MFSQFGAMQLRQCWCYNRKFETRFKYEGLLPKFWKFHRWLIYISTLICACFIKIHWVVFEKIGLGFHHNISYAVQPIRTQHFDHVTAASHKHLFLCYYTLLSGLLSGIGITTNIKVVHLIQTLLWHLFVMRRKLVSYRTKKVLDILLYIA